MVGSIICLPFRCGMRLYAWQYLPLVTILTVSVCKDREGDTCYKVHCNKGGACGFCSTCKYHKTSTRGSSSREAC